MGNCVHLGGRIYAEGPNGARFPTIKIEHLINRILQITTEKIPLFFHEPH